ncbi:SprT family zinc-dependent metalloprotease [Xylophilus sp. GOD-11R]|uniref:M48 family metallopeptidase n=1 Tax=Xylophilus sp. GOD-11R TaxID=3089814 RepID=UPI00298CB30F|nr:SprT family zinc-dependent metalloprotease [Xylophilus sp. GOD-11R]WPB57956.1 SprT family zinc-dependent metalloprotease [Xylophilus sp. GOD-11R]
MAGLIQLALDFLGLSPAEAASSVLPDRGAMPPSSRRKPGATPPGVVPTGGAGKVRAVAPEAPEIPDDVIDAGALPAHPQANREACLLGRRVAYRLERGRRRTVGFTVGAQGLSVRAPGWLPLPQIDAALTEKARWIIDKLVDAESRRDRQDAARIDWRDGARFPLLGRDTVVRLGARRGTEGLREEAGVADAALWLALSADAEPARIGEAVRGWIQRQARRDFAERLDRYAATLDVRWNRLSLTNARTRWGSASSSGAIRLHWRLMHFRPQVIDYVVVHELAHLRHMDHSPRFWAVVGSVLPDYQSLRAELRADSTPRW